MPIPTELVGSLRVLRSCRTRTSLCGKYSREDADGVAQVCFMA